MPLRRGGCGISDKLFTFSDPVERFSLDVVNAFDDSLPRFSGSELLSKNTKKFQK